MNHEFHEFELAGWETVSEVYTNGWGSLTRQSVEPLLDAVGTGPGVELLDMATGPGFVAGAAAARGAVVTGIDFARAMVEEASRRYSTVRFLEDDAEQLRFGDASFDAAVMNFGLLHLAQPDAAIREAFRVLRPGGRFAFTVWSNPGEAAGFGIVLGAIQRHGDMNVALPPGPPFFRFSEPAQCSQALTAAGFTGFTLHRIPQTWRLPSPETFFTIMKDGTVRTRGLLLAQTPPALEAIRQAVLDGASHYAAGNAIELPMPAVLACGLKT